MPVPSPRNPILPARGNYADLLANATSLSDGEICYAIDQDTIYMKEGSSLVPVGGGGGGAVDSVNGQTGVVVLDASDVGAATTAQGSLAESATQPGDNISTLTNDSGYITSISSGELGDLADVDLASVPPTSGEVLGWNGVSWVPTENTGAGSTINSTRYRYENSTDIDNVASGKVRFNNTDFTLVTEIAFSNIDKNGTDISAILQNMIDDNYSVYFQQESSSGKAVLFHLTGPCSNVGDSVRSKFPVEHISDTGSALQSGQDCFTVFSAQATADSVTSVNGQQGAVVLTASDVGALADTAVLNDLSDVNTAGASNGQFLQYNGSNWVPGTASGAPVDSVNGQTGVVVLDADDIDDTSTTHKFATAAQLSAADSAVQPGDLATVATTGSYNDLSNQPTIPAALPDLTDVANPLLITDGDILRYRGSNSRFEPGTALKTDGDNLTGSLTATERTISAGAWDLSTGNFWYCSGGITVPNPTNATAGMSGLIRLAAAPTGWGSNIKHPGGSAESISSFPAVVAFYVESGTSILLSKATQGIA